EARVKSPICIETGQRKIVIKSYCAGRETHDDDLAVRLHGHVLSCIQTALIEWHRRLAACAEARVQGAVGIEASQGCGADQQNLPVGLQRHPHLRIEAARRIWNSRGDASAAAETWVETTAGRRGDAGNRYVGHIGAANRSGAVGNSTTLIGIGRLRSDNN